MLKVNSAEPFKQYRSGPKSGGKSRKVSFCSTDLNEVRTFEVAWDVPKEDLWFTVQELENVKMKSRVDAQVWRKMGHTKLLNDIFKVGTSNHDGISLIFDVQTLINVFCGFDEPLNRRGLERHCSRKHAEQRLDAKDEARYAVIDTQRRLMQNNPGHTYFSNDDRCKSISMVYITASRDSKLHARRMGMGDENAVMGVIPADVIDDVLQFCHSRKARRRLSNHSGSSQSADVSSRDSMSAPFKTEDTRSLLGRMKSLEITRMQTEDLYASIA